VLRSRGQSAGEIPARLCLQRIDFEFEDRFRDLMRLRPSEILAPPVQGGVVGLGLPAHRRPLAGILQIHRGAHVRCSGMAGGREAFHEEPAARL
jgi:hypothetical protein